MGQMVEGPITREAGEALAIYRRVKINSSNKWVYADANDIPHGVTLQSAASGENCAAQPVNATGTVLVTAAGAFSALALLYGADDGKVDDTELGPPQYIALEAASGDGSQVEALPIARTVKGWIPIKLTDWREAGSDDIQNLAAHGGILAKDSTPILEYTNGDTDSALRLNFAASDSNPIVVQIPLPPDLNAGADLVLHMRAAMAGTDDTPTIASDAFFNEGDTKVEDASAAITGATVAEYTITIAAADIPAGAQSVSIELTPGAHTTDALYIYATWIEYEALSA